MINEIHLPYGPQTGRTTMLVGMLREFERQGIKTLYSGFNADNLRWMRGRFNVEFLTVGPLGWDQFSQIPAATTVIAIDDLSRHPHTSIAYARDFLARHVGHRPVHLLVAP